MRRPHCGFQRGRRIFGLPGEIRSFAICGGISCVCPAGHNYRTDPSTALETGHEPIAQALAALRIVPLGSVRPERHFLSDSIFAGCYNAGTDER